MIAILTDFGDSEYLGEMKAVIYRENPKAVVADLCNSIESHGIKEAAWVLSRSYKHFPLCTVFLCVVDPGVGAERKAIAVKTKNHWFAGPDNGLLYPAAQSDGIEKIIELEIPKSASGTFHGRDLFASVAAKLDMGMEPAGKNIMEIKQLKFHLERREGEVVRIDRFGNIITNIPPVKGRDSYRLKTKNLEKELPFYETYEKAKSEVFVAEGSAGTLEMACKNMPACKAMDLKVGDIVELA